MSYTEALLYGAIQGITEYLPISSSAHLILLPKFLQQQDPGLAFDVFLHLGTLMATLIYFWKDWLNVFRTVPKLAPYLGRSTGQGGEIVSWNLIVVATLPALVAGAILHKAVATTFRGNLVLVSTLVLGGVLLFAADVFCPRNRKLSGITSKDAFWIGVMQCLALLPGISRSGSTMTGARILGFDRPASARFSFLISAPITAAAIIFEFRHWNELVEGAKGIGPLLAAGVSSFVFGMLAIGGLLRMLRKFGYLWFAIYRVFLAMFIFKVLGV